MHQPQGCSRVFLMCQASLRPLKVWVDKSNAPAEFLNIWWNTLKKIFLEQSLERVHLTNLCWRMLSQTKLPAVFRMTLWKWLKKKKRQFLDLMCSPKLLQGCRLHHLRTSTRLGWRFRIDWILFILFTSHLRWSPRPLLHKLAADETC